MNGRSTALLYGFLRLAPTQDCIGLAVFREPKMNFDFIAETDGDLRITRFVELYPDHGYCVDELPAGERRRFSVGDAAPIPFVVNQSPVVVSGDRHPSDIDLIVPPSARQINVVLEMKKLLGNARSGFFNERLENWRAEEVRSVYADLFSERPSNSRYWVARYRSAIDRSKGESKLSMRLADEYRSVGTRWLELFGSKTEFARLRLLFKDVDDGVFSRDDLVASVFAHLCHKYARLDFRLLKRLFQTDAYCLGLLPEGLYYHFVKNGFPKVPFKYDKPRDFLGAFNAKLYAANETENLKDARSLALVLFGLEDSPRETQAELAILRRRMTQSYRAAKDEESEHFGWAKYKSPRPFHLNGEAETEYTSLIERIVALFDCLVDLEAIEYGDARLAPRSNDFLSAEREYVDDLRRAVTPGIEESE